MLTNCQNQLYTESNPWQSCLDIIQKRVDPHTFDTWFSNTSLSFNSDSYPCIEVPNQFFADFIEEHFSKLIKESLNKVNIATEKLFYHPVEKKWAVVDEITEEIICRRKIAPPIKATKKQDFYKDYNFESFVVGDSNRFAQATCMAVAEAPGKTSFNPLTIYGGTGLGKTHLLQAIGHFAQTEATSDKVLYITAQEFVNTYIDSVKTGHDTVGFFRKFVDIDLLLLDDIQFFSGKPSTQKEFFRIFSRLLSQNKQIVLTSDRPPEKIPDMMNHIINRFMGGLITDIQPPNFETRIAILRKKAEHDGIYLPDDVFQYIASHVTSNVRELEGTLIKLIASASFTGCDITLDVAQEIFGNVLSRKDQRLTISAIQNKVSEHFGIGVNLLRAHTRKRNITFPRNVAMYLCKHWTKQALRTIGLEFGGRDYSTVIHACKKIEETLKTDKDLQKHISTLNTIIKPLA